MESIRSLFRAVFECHAYFTGQYEMIFNEVRTDVSFDVHSSSYRAAENIFFLSFFRFRALKVD